MPIPKPSFDTCVKSVQSPYGKADDRPTMSTQSLKNLFLNVFKLRDEDAQAASDIELDEPILSGSATGVKSLEFTNKSGQWPLPRTPSESSSPLSDHNDDKESLLIKMLVAKDHNPPADAFSLEPLVGPAHAELLLQVAPYNPPAFKTTSQDLRASAIRGLPRSSLSDTSTSFLSKGRHRSSLRGSNGAWFNSVAQRERRRSMELHKLISFGLLDIETKLNMTKDYSTLGGGGDSSVIDQLSLDVRTHKDSLRLAADMNAKPTQGSIPLPSLGSTCSTGPSTMSDISSLSSMLSMSLSDPCSCTKVDVPAKTPAIKCPRSPRSVTAAETKDVAVCLGHDSLHFKSFKASAKNPKKMEVEPDITTICDRTYKDKSRDSKTDIIRAPSSSCAQEGAPISPIPPLSPSVLRMTRDTAKRQLERALKGNHQSSGGGGGGGGGVAYVQDISPCFEQVNVVSASSSTMPVSDDFHMQNQDFDELNWQVAAGVYHKLTSEESRKGLLGRGGEGAEDDEDESGYNQSSQQYV